MFLKTCLDQFTNPNFFYMLSINQALKHCSIGWSSAFVLILSILTSGVFAQPVFQNVGADQTIACGEVLPDFDGVTAVSNCEGPIQVSSIIYESGNQTQSCAVSTAFGPGIDWAVWLPLLDAPSVSWNFIGDQQLAFYANGTGRLTGTIENSVNPNWQMTIEIWFENGRNWTDWSSLGRGYKNDLGLAASNYLDWMYYELNPTFSHMTGIGALDGSELSLTHLPANYYFGFQVGVASNNKNGNDGMSGWFAYSGTFNGETVTGNGDVNIDRSCQNNEQECGSTAFTAVYRAEDACGNVAFEERVITVVDNTAPVIDAVESPIFISCSQQANIFIAASDACSSVEITFIDDAQQAGCPGLITRTYTVTDACDNSSQATQQIYLVEEGNLEFTVFPADTSVSCTDALTLNPVIEYSQVCFNTQLTQSEVIEAGNCPANYTLIRTYSLSDACGNTASQVWAVVVSDNGSPAFTSVAEDLQLICGDEAELNQPTIFDACSEVTVTASQVTQPLTCAYQVITTWTATDACGNSATAQQTTTYSDDVDPEFSFIPESVTLNCGDPFVLDTAEVVDGCSEVTLAWTDEPLYDCAGSYIRIWRAFDGCGNQALESTVVTFVDTEAPTLVGIPESNNGSCGSPDFDANVTALDNCDQNPTVTIDVVSVPGNCGSISTYTWTATDACGNTSTQTRTYTLTDDFGPVFEGPIDTIYAICGDAESLLNIPSPTVTDACSEVTSVTSTDTEIASDCGSIIVRTYTAADGCGNTSSVDRVIVLTDNTPPVFVTIPQDVQANCGGADQNTELPVVTDDCSEVLITYNDEVITSEGCSGTLLRQWIATDACGNVSTVQQTIAYTDDSAPVIISAPEDLTASCSEVPEVDLNAIVFEDNCSNTTVSVTENLIPGFCPGGYNIERIWTVTDACGNSVSATQFVYVVDEEAPVLTGVPADASIVCGFELEISAVSATDNCTASEDIAITVVDELLSASCGSIIQRIYSASDACGNTTNIVQQISLIDDEAPVFISVPAATSILCGYESGLLNAVAADGCSEVTITEERVASGDCANSFIRIFTATDACGNSVTAQQVVTVEDLDAPSFAGVPLTITLNCGDELPTADVVAVDACGTVTMAHSDDAQETPCGSQVVRTYTATDGCGNTAQFAQVIEFIDVTGPVFDNVPADLFLSCGDQAPAVQVPTALDACSGAAEVIYDDIIEPGFCTGSYAISRVFTAGDNCGNISTVTQTIFFNDNVPPVFDAFEAQLEVACGEVNQPYATASDNCGNVTVSYEDEFIPGNCGLRTRTYTAADACGNIAQATQVISVVDEIAPVFIGFPASQSISCSDVVPVEQVDVAYADDCSEVTVSWVEDIIEGDCPNSYTSIRTCTLTDVCGNTATETYTLEVSDTEAPQIIGVPEDITLNCGDDLPVVDVFVVDNCTAEPVFTLSETMETIGCTMIVTRRWTAADECGNVTQSVQIVTYIDETLPIFSEYPDDLILICGTDLPEAPFITAIDDCSGEVAVTFTEIVTSSDPCAMVERSWCAIDCSGNEACFTQLIIFEQPQASLIQDQPEVRAWQNAADEMLVSFTANTAGRWGLDLYDLNGRKVINVFAGEMKAGETRTIAMDIEQLIRGVYIMGFSNGEQKATQRLPIIR
jgi:hypothetical protein